MQNEPKSIWDRLWSNRNWEVSCDQVTRQQILMDFLGGVYGQKIIELGIGTGFDSIFLASKGASIIGLDLSGQVIKLCRENFVKYGAVLNVLKGDVQYMPIKNESMDIIYSAGLLEHFNNPDPIITEMVRITKINGFIVCFVPQTFSWWTVRKKREMKQNKWFAGWETNYSFWRLKKVFNRPNLRLKYLKGFHICVTPWDLYERYYFYGRKGWLLRELDKCVIVNIFGKEIGILVQKTS